jgi:uncharacterized membrane protein (UPF0127 family)
MAKKEVLISKWQLLFIGAFFVCFIFLIFWNSRTPQTEFIMLGEESLEVYVAKTLKDTYKGLGGREDLDGKDGMLFLFDFSSKHGIVMRDMLFPIDIVWLDGGRVVDIAPAVPIEFGVPEYALTSYRPRSDANMVLELPAGWSVQNDLHIGDALRMP